MYFLLCDMSHVGSRALGLTFAPVVKQYVSDLPNI